MESELGATKTTVGRIDGFMEFIAYLIRIFSGFTSDIFQNRKMVLGVGYGLSALAKPLFAIAGSVTWVVWVRVLDRLSNGIQASPRDALVGDIAPKSKRGASYGLAKSLKTAGSVLGALLAIKLMMLSSDKYRLVFNIAFIPAILALLLLVFGVREPKHRNKFVETKAKDKKGFSSFKWKTFLELNGQYWKIILLAVVFSLAHFGESYLVFRGADAGLSPTYIPMVMILFNLGQFSVSYPLGRLSDRVPRRFILLIGFLCMCFASLLLGHSTNLIFVMVGVFLWGAQLGSTQSVFVSMISDTVPQYIRGTAFGIFYFTLALCILVSSWFAGPIWEFYGHEVLFTISALISLGSCGFLFLLVPKNIRKLS